jgi:hypothetical protein
MILKEDNINVTLIESLKGLATEGFNDLQLSCIFLPLLPLKT